MVWKHLHNTKLHVINATQLAPAIIFEIRAMFEQPLHRGGIFFLSRRRTWIARITSNAYHKNLLVLNKRSNLASTHLLCTKWRK